MAFTASAATSSTGLLTASWSARLASPHKAALLNSLISSGCLGDSARYTQREGSSSGHWPRQHRARAPAGRAHRVSSSANSSRPCLCSSGLLVFRFLWRLRTTDSIPRAEQTPVLTRRERLCTAQGEGLPEARGS